MARDHVGWRAHVAEQEVGVGVDRLVVLPVEDVEELVSVVFVGRDNVQDFFLDGCVWHTAFKGTLLSVECWADSIGNFLRIDDFTVRVLSEDACEE